MVNLLPDDPGSRNVTYLMDHGNKYWHPRDEIMQTMERIYRYRMTTTSGGNISIREDDGTIWITPAGVDKGGLRRDDIACVHPDGTTDGPHRPSSEFPFHQMIYGARDDVRAVVHAHAVALVAFSITSQVPDTHLFHQSRDICGEVGFAPYAVPGSADLGANIAATFRAGSNCVLLQNHGIAVGAESLSRAFQRFETLEFTAKTIIKARLLGPIRFLSDAEIRMPQEIEPFPEFERTAATSKEKELRRQLFEFIRRGYQQRLFISTGGSFSARVNDNSFLITSYQVDRNSMTPADLVLIQEGKAEAGKRPSRAARLHHAIYKQHSNINSILNAFPVNATAFSVSNVALDSRTIPESYLLLREVERVPYGQQFSRPEAVAAKISRSNPVLILENDGALVVGGSVLEAFDRLEVLESTAEALINSRLIGEVSAMSDSVIDDLKEAFSAMLG